MIRVSILQKSARETGPRLSDLSKLITLCRSVYVSVGVGDSVGFILVLAILTVV